MIILKDPKQMKKYIWKGLNPVRFKPLAVVLSGDSPIIIMYETNSDSVKPWCVEYRGSGRYFATLEELSEYCANRWNFDACDILAKEEESDVRKSV